MIWFTSDEHYHHANIIKYCERPFSSVEEMDDTIIRNHNALVSDGDSVYHLGDFVWGNDHDAQAILDQLNGHHTFIKGSHDGWMEEDHPQIMELNISGKYPRPDLPHVPHNLIVLCHYAMRTWARSFDGSYQLHGHSHGRLKSIGRQMDVGVDCWAFNPVSLDVVISRLSKVPLFDSEMIQGSVGSNPTGMVWSYEDYLRSPEWRAKCDLVFERDGYRCATCGSEHDLEVHHKTYKHLFNEPLEDLITLCKECHDAITSVFRRRRYSYRDYQPSESIRQTPEQGKEKKNDAKDFEIRNQVRITPALTQRADGRSDEQIFEGSQADQRQTRKDGR